MKRFIQFTLASFITLVGISAITPLAPTAGAIDVFSGLKCDGGGAAGSGTATTDGTASTGDDAATTGGGSGGGQTAICGAKQQDELPAIVKNVINTILLVLGMVAVVMIILGGVRYTTSQGDSGAITGAKNTILYAVIGLVVAILSFAIVNFVIDQIGK